MNNFLNPSGKPVLQGVLLFAFGFVLLLYALGVLVQSVTILMIVVALGLMAAGFFMAGFNDVVKSMFNRKKE